MTWGRYLQRLNGLASLHRFKYLTLTLRYIKTKVWFKNDRFSLANYIINNN